MLHILWLILKFILIVLGVLLGLVLLALLLVLFCPVRYRAQGQKRSGEWKAVEGTAYVSWLFRGVTFRAGRKDGKNCVEFRLFGISLNKLLERRKKKKETAKEKETEGSTEDSNEQNIEEAAEKTQATAENKEENSSARADEGKAAAKHADQSDAKIASAAVDSDSEETPEEFLGDDWLTEPSQEENAEETSEKKGLSQRISERLSAIRASFQSLGQKYHKIQKKKDWWKKFLQHPRTKEAISLVWKYAKGLLRHILPTKVWGKLTFGFSDPSVTGRVLGFLGMSFPLHKNCIAVTPLFTGENVLEGEIYLKGRIYGIVLVKAVIVIYFNKNVKYVIRKMKRRNQ